jgi:hypothetical protein
MKRGRVSHATLGVTIVTARHADLSSPSHGFKPADFTELIHLTVGASSYRKGWIAAL